MVQAFESVVPSELTKLRLQIHDGSLLITPSPPLESRLVLSIVKLNLATNLMPDLPRTIVALELFGLRVLAVDGKGDLGEPDAGVDKGIRWWKV